MGIEYVYVWLCLRVGVVTSEQHVIVLASDLVETVFFNPDFPHCHEVLQHLHKL